MVEKHNVHDDEEIIQDSETISDSPDIELENEEEMALDKLKSLREKLKRCEEEKLKNLEDLQRARADFLNSKRRIEEQLARDKERAADKILVELLTLADSFDIAMGDKEQWSTLDPKWKSGIEAIHGKLASILRSYHITSIDPAGKPFDPEEHEAVSNITVTDDDAIDTVISVLQKGYKRGSDILRPARVVVGTK